MSILVTLLPLLIAVDLLAAPPGQVDQVVGEVVSQVAAEEVVAEEAGNRSFGYFLPYFRH